MFDGKFRGRFEHTLDPKGRLSIPSRYREILKELYDSRLMVTTYGSCLRAYPFSEWQVLEDKVLALPQFHEDRVALVRHFFSKAAECSIDKLGRVLIPQSMRDFAKLEKDVMRVGELNVIEIWDKAMWLESEASEYASDDHIVKTLGRHNI
jgi:MraZ protein